MTPRYDHPVRISRSRIPLAAVLFAGASTLLPVFAGAQFAGPAPTKKDSVNANGNLTTDRHILEAPLPGFRLRPGDLFQVAVFGVKDFTETHLRVTSAGEVAVPLAGVIHVEGLTLEQAEQAIRERLIALGMLVDPQVTIVLEDQPTHVISVLGEVKSPNTVPANGEHHLLEVISAAGGLLPTASNTVSIERPGVDLPIRVKIGPDPDAARNANIALYPGDTVIVPKIGVVYVVGAFRTQTAFALQNNAPLTLMQAVSLAGGAGFEGAKDQMRIIRSIGEDRSEIRVNLAHILNGKDPDPVLQQNDIVFLPTSGFRAAVKGGATAIAVGLATSVLNVTYR